MYVPALFAETDPSAITSLLDRHPLATLVLVKDGVAQADHIPFVRLGGVAVGEQLVAHVSKSNDTWRLIGAGCEALLVFAGGSAYISPSLYPSKKTTHEVVPTWNYASVHLRGRMTCSHDSGEKRGIVEQLTRKMESARSEPWAVSDAPAAYIDRMLAGIVALRFEIESMTAKFKASQNRTTEDREGVIAGLAKDPATQEGAQLAAGIRKLNALGPLKS
jgi:transcriptional regulator